MIAHFAAVRARLAADTALRVEDTALVDGSGLPVAAQYVILFGGSPDVLDDDRLTAPQLATSDAEYVYPVRAVSVTAEGVRAVLAKVHAQLIGFAPTVTGRNCSRMRLTDANPVEADHSISPPLYYADVEFTLNSSRA